MSRSRSSSRGRDRSRDNSRSRSRGGSRSRSPANRRRDRSGDRRSPRGGGRNARFARDDPPPSKCLGVFNLSSYTTDKDLKDVFGEFGDIEKVDMVYDRPSGHSRGFGFVYFYDLHDAAAARDKLTNTDLDGHKIRVDYSFTKRAHSPTPGQYMGERDEPRGGYRGRDRDGGRRDYRRSPERGGRFGGRSDRYGGSSRGSRPYDPSFRRRVESYANGGGSSSSHRRRSSSRS